jgi:hypothetical protein
MKWDLKKNVNVIIISLRKVVPGISPFEPAVNPTVEFCGCSTECFPGITSKYFMVPYIQFPGLEIREYGRRDLSR